MSTKFERQSNGKTFLLEPSEKLFLLDESLSPNVAKALCLVQYKFITVFEAFGGRSGVLDPEIIEWARVHNAIWVSADDRARKKHRAQILSANIGTLWIYRPRGQMSSREQLRILSYVLPNLIEQHAQHPRHLHYEVAIHGEANRTRIRLMPVDL
jgi:predicted nuclease of predicted toxin-antitoxin system